MAIKFTFTMSDKNVVAAISDIGTRSKGLRTDMHSVAVSILHNWAKSGAVNVAANRATAFLAEADGAHKQKIVNWFAAHAGFVLDGDEFVYGDKTTLTTADYQAAKAETMFALTPDKKPEPAVDFRALLLKAITVAKKRRVAGVREEDNVDDALIGAVESLLGDDDS